YSCTSTITLRGLDASTGNASTFSMIELVADTTDMEEVYACIPMFGTVADIDGNTYQPVVIGEQVWMAEELRTSRYRDGSIIPNVTDVTGWINLTTGAWCNYDNNSDYDTIYGKLYNWHAAANPNICPQGWHVPTN